MRRKGSARGAQDLSPGGPHASQQLLRATRGRRMLGPGAGHHTLPAPPAPQDAKAHGQVVAIAG
eukprot:5926610-Heterocapsa_arctica.AAC.1